MPSHMMDREPQNVRNGFPEAVSMPGELVPCHRFLDGFRVIQCLFTRDTLPTQELIP